MAISQQILDSLINGSLIKVFFKDYRGDLPSLVDLTSLRNPLWHPGLGWKVPRFPSPECHEMNTMLGLWSINSSYFLLKCSYFNAWFNEWYRLFWEQFVVEGLEESKESIKLHREEGRAYSWLERSLHGGEERGSEGISETPHPRPIHHFWIPFRFSPTYIDISFLTASQFTIVLCLVVQSCLTPWTVAHQAPLSMEILQARMLEWVAMPSSRGSSQPRDWTQVSHVAGGFFTSWATREAFNGRRKTQFQLQKSGIGRCTSTLLTLG